MEWSRILFLVLLYSASVAYAAEPPIYTTDHFDPPLVTWNNLKISELKFAAATDADGEPETDATVSNQKETKSRRDCDALTYEVTLFNPCPGENGKRLWNVSKVVFVGGFAVMGVIGAVTKRDLGFLSTALLVALLALIFIGIFSIFSPLTSTGMLAYSFIGAIVFSLYVVFAHRSFSEVVKWEIQVLFCNKNDVIFNVLLFADSSPDTP